MPLKIPTAIRGLNEIELCADGGYTHLVSILDPSAPAPTWPVSLATLPRLDLRFDDATVATPGSMMFADAHVDALAAFAAQVAEVSPASLLLHCTYGMSRSTACAGILHAAISPELSGVAIFIEILRGRSITWPNLHIVEVADKRLGRNGDLIAGAKAIYRFQLLQKPEWGEELIRVGRGREVHAGASGDIITL